MTEITEEQRLAYIKARNAAKELVIRTVEMLMITKNEFSSAEIVGAVMAVLIVELRILQAYNSHSEEEE